MGNSTGPSKRHANETQEQRERRLAYHREWMRRHREAHPEIHREVSRRYYEKHSEKIKQRYLERYARDREKIIASVCEYSKRNREKINATRRTREAADPEKTKRANRKRYLAYREKDKAKRMAKRAELAAYMRRKRNEDLKFLVADRLRRRINSALACRKTRKAGGLAELSGCTLDELVAHIEKQFADGMSWGNRRQWHIDHIIPCSAFDMTDKIQQQIAFHYTNLRPAWASENQAKSARLPDGQRRLFWTERDVVNARKKLQRDA
jgi:hypothetical protein